MLYLNFNLSLPSHLYMEQNQETRDELFLAARLTFDLNFWRRKLLKSKSSIPKSSFYGIKKTYTRAVLFLLCQRESRNRASCIFLLLLSLSRRKERSDEQTGSGRCSVARFVIALVKFHAKVSYESTFEYTGLSEVGRVTRVQSGRDVPGEQTAPEMPPPKDQSQQARPLALINWPPPPKD